MQWANIKYNCNKLLTEGATFGASTAAGFDAEDPILVSIHSCFIKMKCSFSSYANLSFPVSKNKTLSLQLVGEKCESL